MPFTVSELIELYDVALNHCAPEQVAETIIKLGQEIDRLDGKNGVYERIAREHLT